MSDPGTELTKSSLNIVDKILQFLFEKNIIKNEPKRIRAKAEAEADALKIGIIANIECAERVANAKNRIALVENQRQKNLNTIGEKAILFIDKDVEINIEKFDDTDWYIRFLNNAQDVSDEDIQKIWAKVLAGKITKKYSFSLRTLDVLHNISKTEAEIFQRLSSRVIRGVDSDHYFIFNLKSNYLKKVGIGALEQMVLRESGLLNPTEFTNISIET